MKTTPKSNRSLKKLKLALLAGTCLGTAVNAGATTIVESTDFSNDITLALASPLPDGTDLVIGTVTNTSDEFDIVAFQNLLPGGAFTLTFTDGGTGDYFDFTALDSTNTAAGTADPGNNEHNALFTGTVPADGILVASVGYSEGSGPYNINLTAATVPEPSTAALAALGLAAVATRRRSRRIPLAK